MIGIIGLEVVQEEERRLQEKHVNYWESEAFWEEDRKWCIRIFDVQAKRRAAYTVWQKSITELKTRKSELMSQCPTAESQESCTGV